MIEINIPSEAAISLLKDQVTLEFKRQKRIRLLDENDSIGNLSESNFKEIVEIALFDILMLLPVTLITEKSNLKQIITKTVRALDKFYNYEFLSIYVEKEAEWMLYRVRKPFKNYSSTTSFQNN